MSKRGSLIRTRTDDGIRYSGLHSIQSRIVLCVKCLNIQNWAVQQALWRFLLCPGWYMITSWWLWLVSTDILLNRGSQASRHSSSYYKDWLRWSRQRSRLLHCRNGSHADLLGSLYSIQHRSSLSRFSALVFTIPPEYLDIPNFLILTWTLCVPMAVTYLCKGDRMRQWFWRVCQKCSFICIFLLWEPGYWYVSFRTQALWPSDILFLSNCEGLAIEGLSCCYITRVVDKLPISTRCFNIPDSYSPSALRTCIGINNQWLKHRTGLPAIYHAWRILQAS